MSLILEAAKQWTHLLNCEYSLTIGRKGKMQELKLTFRSEDFDHLAGMQYADDVDFKLHPNEYRGAKLIPALLAGKVDGALLEKSRSWERIQDRLHVVLNLEKILDDDFEVYRFESKKLPFYSKIKASYCIYSDLCNKGIFLFWDGSDQYYCKSVFSFDGDNDYRKGQARWTLLHKFKTESGIAKELFRYEKYKEPTMV